MEFSFESLEVYNKCVALYGLIARGAVTDKQATALGDLRHGILEICRNIIGGSTSWSREYKIRHYLFAMDLARAAVPLVEGALLEGSLTREQREEARGELDGLVKMLSSLARKSRDWSPPPVTAEPAPAEAATSSPGRPARRKN